MVFATDRQPGSYSLCIHHAFVIWPKSSFRLTKTWLVTLRALQSSVCGTEAVLGFDASSQSFYTFLDEDSEVELSYLISG